MEAKRTVNYYDCYEVGYATMLFIGQGTPDHWSKHAMLYTAKPEMVKELAKKYGIRLLNKYFEDSFDEVDGYYLVEAETTTDPDTFDEDFTKLEELFKKEAKLKDLRRQLSSLDDEFNGWDCYIKTDDGFIINPELSNKYNKLAWQIKELSEEIKDDIKTF